MTALAPQETVKTLMNVKLEKINVQTLALAPTLPDPTNVPVQKDMSEMEENVLTRMNVNVAPISVQLEQTASTHQAATVATAEMVL